MILSIILANALAVPSTPSVFQSSPASQINQSRVASAEAIYTIPEAEGMEAPMSFVMQDAKFMKDTKSAVMSFRLPAALNGFDGKKFVLQGAVDGNTILMQGDGAKASCDTALRATECKIEFDRLDLDHQASDLLIDNQITGPLADAIKIGREAFEHQAVGVIRFEH